MRDSASVYRPSSASIWNEPSVLPSACSSSSAVFVSTCALITWPPSKPTSTRTRWSSATCHQLREHPVHGIGVDERDLEPEEAAVRLLVDQLDALGRETSELVPQIADFVRHVMHPGAALGQELADRRLLAERCQQLDAALATPVSVRFHALLGAG